MKKHTLLFSQLTMPFFSRSATPFLSRTATTLLSYTVPTRLCHAATARLSRAAITLSLTAMSLIGITPSAAAQSAASARPAKGSTKIAPDKNPLRLWYDTPSGDTWERALPIGNGRLAAMVYGNTEQECIQLNESTVWSGGPNRNDGERALAALPQVRKLIFEGKFKEADSLASAEMKTSPIDGMMYQTVGNLNLHFPGHGQPTAYYRDLDLGQALTTTVYTANGIKYTREIFASAPDQVMIVRLTANTKGSISFVASMSTPQRGHVSTNRNDRLWLSGISGDQQGIKGSVKFQALVKAQTDGGKVSADDTSLTVTNANSVTLFISIGTNFVNYKNLSADEKQRAVAWLEAAAHKPYDQLRRDHIRSYQKYFDRVKLDLGTSDSIRNPTDARIRSFRKGNDPQLAALYFQYGRYLLISASRPGGQPANLQGIWNKEILPPWGSKYTININTEMNYWPAEETNLAEMHAPLIAMVKDISVTGQQTARVMYGARGWVTHHNTDLWRIDGPVDGISSGLWPMGGVWLSRHLWDRYLYNGDIAYLQSVYDAMKGSAQFCLDFLTEEPEHHWLVISPSLSPENGPASHNGLAIEAGVTVDNQLVFELFSNVIRAASILHKDQGLIDSLTAARLRLPPMQIGQYGQLQEWLHDLDDPNDHNRHVSHLFGLYPSNQISPIRTPALFDAARTSLIQRSDISTGWSMGWKVNLWARLLDGNHAFKLVQNQLTPAGENEGEANSGGGTYPNLFDAHPPFQIDGNFGCTAGIAEMLLQSHDGAIHVLPALPDEWQAGRIGGLRALGGFEIVDMVWSGGHLTKLIIKSTLGGNCRIRTQDQLQLAKNSQGKAGPVHPAGNSPKLIPATGDNPNSFYATYQTADPLISSKAKLNPTGQKNTRLYDLPTQAGKIYTLVAAPQ